MTAAQSGKPVNVATAFFGHDRRASAGVSSREDKPQEANVASTRATEPDPASPAAFARLGSLMTDSGNNNNETFEHLARF